MKKNAYFKTIYKMLVFHENQKYYLDNVYIIFYDHILRWHYNSEKTNSTLKWFFKHNFHVNNLK